ncbi:MAG: cytochrome c [Caulobacter sp.]|nr:cytochrome c [Caulobacter sp.]
MLTQIDASADKIWGSAGSISDEHGFRDLAPTTDAQWEELRAATITLVEAPNLLIQEGRPVARPGGRIQDQGLEGVAPPDQIQKALISDRPAFLQHAQRLQTVAGEILSAVDRRDAAALEKKGAELDEACEACHQRFWYPPKPK